MQYVEGLVVLEQTLVYFVFLLPTVTAVVSVPLWSIVTPGAAIDAGLVLFSSLGFVTEEQETSAGADVTLPL